MEEDPAFDRPQRALLIVVDCVRRAGAADAAALDWLQCNAASLVRTALGRLGCASAARRGPAVHCAVARTALPAPRLAMPLERLELRRALRTWDSRGQHEVGSNTVARSEDDRGHAAALALMSAARLLYDHLDGPGGLVVFLSGSNLPNCQPVREALNSLRCGQVVLTHVTFASPSGAQQADPLALSEGHSACVCPVAAPSGDAALELQQAELVLAGLMPDFLLPTPLPVAVRSPGGQLLMLDAVPATVTPQAELVLACPCHGAALAGTNGAGPLCCPVSGDALDRDDTAPGCCIAGECLARAATQSPPPGPVAARGLVEITGYVPLSELPLWRCDAPALLLPRGASRGETPSAAGQRQRNNETARAVGALLQERGQAALARSQTDLLTDEAAATAGGLVYALTHHSCGGLLAVPMLAGLPSFSGIRELQGRPWPVDEEALAMAEAELDAVPLRPLASCLLQAAQGGEFELAVLQMRPARPPDQEQRGSRGSGLAHMFNAENQQQQQQQPGGAAPGLRRMGACRGTH